MPDWRKLYDEHASALLLYARQWCPSTSDAEDAVQDGFIRWWKTAADNPSPSIPLLFAAVRGAAIDRFRSQARRVRRETETGHPGADIPCFFEPGIVQDEKQKIVEHALHAIPDEQREVLVLKLWGGRTFDEIGNMLGISQNTAASRYRYALENVSRLLRPMKDDLV